MHLKLWQKICILVVLPLVFELVLACTLGILLVQAEQIADHLERTKQELVVIHDAEQSLVESIFKLFGTYNKDGTDCAVDLNDCARQLARNRDELLGYADVSPEITESFNESNLPALCTQGISLVDQAKKIFANRSIPAKKRALYVRRPVFSLLIGLNPVLSRLLGVEAHIVEVTPIELARVRTKVALVGIFALFGSGAVSIAMSQLFLKNIASRLNVIEENANSLASGQMTLKEISGDDEISELNRALQRAANMIGEVKRKELTVLEMTVDVLFSLDANLRVVGVGDAVLKAWGYLPSDLIGRSFLALVASDSAEFASSFRQSNATEPEIEVSIKAADQKVLALLIKVSWLSNRETYFCVAHDITESKAIASKKQKLVRLASDALRQPLSEISTTLRMLLAGQRGALPELAKNKLARASRSMTTLTELIEDLLDMEQLQSGKINLKLAATSASSVCSDAIETLMPLAQKHGVQIQYPTEDAIVAADPRRLLQVILNLLSNAIKYSPSGQSVLVSIEPQGKFVKISVRDNGAGIPENELQSIFEKFYQTKTKTEAPIKGTGLGLAIAQAIVEAHHGRIEVESSLGKGSCFSVLLPLEHEGALR